MRSARAGIEYRGLPAEAELIQFTGVLQYAVRREALSTGAGAYCGYHP